MSAQLKSFGIGILLFSSLGWGTGGNQIQIKKFRFHQHLGLDFERLVLEFSQKGAGVPSVRVSPIQNGKDTTLAVNDAELVGAIPEATINDSYSKTSRYIGPISINNDNPTLGFSIRTFVKNPGVGVDAFWLKNPMRLIVDVYPKSSLRAQGPEVLTQHTRRGLASQRHKMDPNRNVICFFTAAQVSASLGFELGANPKPLHMKVDDNGVDYTQDKNVICYPVSAQAQPRINFDLRTGAPAPAPAPKVSMEAPRPQQKPVVQQPAPQQAPGKVEWNTGRPLTKDEQLNRDADLALGLPGDADLEGRGLASPGLFGGEDNFDKNKPPPTLGKSLSSPNVASGGRPPILANPGAGGYLPK